MKSASYNVPRVSKHDEVEVQQPRLLPAQDREVRGVQRLVRERLMHHRRHGRMQRRPERPQRCAGTPRESYLAGVGVRFAFAGSS